MSVIEGFKAVDGLLTQEELSARYGGVPCVRTIQNWRNGNGKGPRHIKVGKRVMYPLAWVVEWERTISREPSRSEMREPESID